MSTISGGSISGSPSFPFIDGFTSGEISADLTARTATYNSAKATFDAANILVGGQANHLLQARTDLQAKQEALAALQADPNATAAQIAAAQAEVEAAEATYQARATIFAAAQADFNTAADALVTATNNLFDATVDFVSALARQQMLSAHNSDSAIASLVSQLSSAMGTPDSNTPSWMLSVIVAATPDASDAERTAIINAFNTYRLLEYNIALTRKTFVSAYMEHLKNYYAWVASGPTGSYPYDTDTNWATACSSQTQIDTLISQRPAVLAALNDATTSLGQPLRDALNYLQSGSALTSKLMEFFSDGYAAKVAADQIALAAHISEYPTENAAYIAATVGPRIAELMAAKAALISSSMNFPELTQVTGEMSMSDLMRIISKIQLMVQDLAKYVREMDNRLGDVWLAALLIDFDIEKNRAQAYNDWIDIVKEADQEYNSTIIADNETEISQTLSTLQYLVDNSGTIQSTIDAVNTQIDAWNDLITATTTPPSTNTFIEACNDVSQAIIDAINASRDTYPEAPNYLDFFDFDQPDVTAPSSLSAPNLFQGSYEEIPGATLDTSAINAIISSLTDIQTNLATYSPDDLAALISSLNDSLQAVVKDLSPALDRIQTLIPLGQEFDLTKIFMKETVPDRSFQAYLPTFYMQFVQNVSNLIAQANISERDKANLNKLLADLLQIVQTRTAEQERQEIGSPGVSFGIEAVTVDENVAAVSPIITKIAESEVLANSILGSIQGAALMAGLVAMGANEPGLSSQMGISISERFEELGINLKNFLDQKSSQAILLAFSEQLALTAAQSSSLQKTAVNILAQTSGVSGLNAEQTKELLSFLVMLLQFVFLFAAMLSAAAAGMSSAQFLTQIASKFGGTSENILTAFQALGLPQEKAIALGVALGGDATELQGFLRNIGLDAQASTYILALIAAQEGKISLTEGVVGGPAFLDALLKKVEALGIHFTAQIGSPEFRQQLVSALQAKATAAQFEILQAELKRIADLNSGKRAQDLTVEKAVNDLIEGLKKDLSAPTSVAPTEVTKPGILPSEILAEYVREFMKLSDTTRSELIAIAQKQLTGLTGLSDEQKASLIIAVKLGRVTATEALSLAALSQLESKGILEYSNTVTELISRLFRESPEAKLAREEAVKRSILDTENRFKELLPTALSQRIIDNIAASFERVINNFDNKEQALKVVERFSTFVEKLTSLPKVNLRLMTLDVLPLRMFSILFESAQDRLKQPPTLYGGR